MVALGGRVVTPNIALLAALGPSEGLSILVLTLNSPRRAAWRIGLWPPGRTAPRLRGGTVGRFGKSANVTDVPPKAVGESILRHATARLGLPHGEALEPE